MRDGLWRVCKGTGSSSLRVEWPGSSRPCASLTWMEPKSFVSASGMLQVPCSIRYLRKRETNRIARSKFSANRPCATVTLADHAGRQVWVFDKNAGTKAEREQVQTRSLANPFAQSRTFKCRMALDAGASANSHGNGGIISPHQPSAGPVCCKIAGGEAEARVCRKQAQVQSLER